MVVQVKAMELLVLEQLARKLLTIMIALSNAYFHVLQRFGLSMLWPYQVSQTADKIANPGRTIRFPNALLIVKRSRQRNDFG